MITVAIPKGRILQDFKKLLQDLDINIKQEDERSLILNTCSDRGLPDFRLMIVRNQDVLTYVQHFAAQMGVIGQDMLDEEDNSHIYNISDLKIAKCKMVLAAPLGFKFKGKDRVRVASKYPKQAKKFFDNKGMHVDLIKLNGSMELAPLTGLCDVIIDLVSSGQTLKANGLVALEQIKEISVQLIVNQIFYKTKFEEVNALASVLDSKEN